MICDALIFLVGIGLGHVFSKSLASFWDDCCEAYDQFYS